MLRILVVDDDRDTAVSLQMVLELWGYEVRAAHSGIAALRMAERFVPGLVILDLAMPEMDGYELARRLRDSRRDGLTIVCLSGYGTEEDQHRSRAVGCDYHFLKPVELPQLQRILKAIG